MKEFVNVVGAGLAGCEAAWQIAKRGINVRLYEMKPHKHTEAHHIDSFGELVCSNSLRSDQLENAAGLLKEEMRHLDSLIMKCADKTKVPAGGALAVDREKFSDMITDRIKALDNVTIINGEVTEIPDGEITVVATGPLTSEPFFMYLKKVLGEEYLHFFDAAAPIVSYDSINMDKAFKAARYGKGSDDYINCPLNQQEYDLFWNGLVNAELADVKYFEKEILFEGCMPIESMAKRGKDTIRFGPLKPVGLIDPNTSKEAYAVVQLRQDNSQASLYNIVGFQTRLKWGEQKRIFGLIPGLENAEFVRYGVMHRNTFINSPKLLDNTFSLKSKAGVFFAGQMTGVEGYIESAASGLVAGLNAAMFFSEKEPVVFPTSTAIGALGGYISNSTIKDFQPMNINFGIIDPLNKKIRDKKQKNQEIAQIAIEAVDSIVKNWDGE